jgi:hypothetical protein
MSREVVAAARATLRIRPRPGLDADRPGRPADRTAGDRPADQHPRPVPPPRQPASALPTADAAPADLDVVPDAAPADLDVVVAGNRRTPRRTVTPITTLAVAVLCVLVGGLAGHAEGANAARHGMLSGTRVMLWADSVAIPVTTGPAGPAGPARPVTIRVSLTATTGPVTLEQIRFATGFGQAQPQVTLRPGEQTSTDLVLHPDCDRIGAGLRMTTWAGSDEPAADAPRAVVRIRGSQLSAEVPLDLVGDPATVMVALLAPCSASDPIGE